MMPVCSSSLENACNIIRTLQGGLHSDNMGPCCLCRNEDKRLRRDLTTLVPVSWGRHQAGKE